MSLRFMEPWWLLLLPVAFWFFWSIARQSYSGLSPLQRKLSLFLRLLIAGMLIVALASPQLVSRIRELTVMFVLDASKSVSSDEVQRGLDFARQSQRKMKTGDRSGLIVFGEQAKLSMVAGEGKLPVQLPDRPQASGSDISSALRLAMASFPEKSSRHIVLISDGNETVGSAVEQARIAQTSGVAVDTLRIGKPTDSEVWIESLDVPTRLRKGEPFDARVVIGSSAAQTATLRLYKSGVPAGERQVNLNKGKNVLLLPQKEQKEGGQRWRVDLDPKADTHPENNKAYAYSIVEGKPKLLLATNNPTADSLLARSLDDVDIDLKMVTAGSLPSSALEYTGIDGLILSNIPATDLNADQMFAVRGAVRQLGMGFAMLGGDDSFGAGGYFKTPVEEALPVRMTIRKQKVIPSMAVLIIIDKSGSMAVEENGVEKLKLAAEAAVASLETLQPKDLLAVIACDSDPQLVAPMRPAKLKEQISADIRSIRVGGGGIMVYSSLKRAQEVMEATNTTIRHIILLADGADAEEQLDSLSLVKQMAADKITVTAVAIGNGQDVGFLQEIARYGKGGFYLTESAFDLPKIFTKDTMMASRSLLVEEPFRPIIDPAAEILEGIDFSATPRLFGYVAATPKESSSQAMISHHEDPILVTWHYGLGRSLAFTSDARAKWAKEWQQWASFSSFWAQNSRWILRKNKPTPWQSEVAVGNGKATVRAVAIDDSGAPISNLDLTARLAGPDGKTQTARMNQIGIGEYEAEFPASLAGDYVASVSKTGQSEEEGIDIASASLAYPEEYRTTNPDSGLLMRVSSESGGTYNPNPEDVFRKAPREDRTYRDLWRILVIAAFVLLPFDVAVRRLVVTRQEVSEAVEHVRQRLPGRQQPVARPEVSTTGLLQKRKARLKDTTEPVNVISVQNSSSQPDTDIVVSQTREASEKQPEQTGQPESGRRSLLESKRKRGSS